MSKHVWRMHSEYNMMCGIQASEPDLTDRANCTLVPNEACFPVLQAMRLCRLMDKQDQSFEGTAELGEALASYRKAVTRMKARKERK